VWPCEHSSCVLSFTLCTLYDVVSSPVQVGATKPVNGLSIASQEDGDISQGSVTTSLRYVGIISDEFTTNVWGESKIFKFN